MPLPVGNDHRWPPVAAGRGGAPPVLAAVAAELRPGAQRVEGHVVHESAARDREAAVARPGPDLDRALEDVAGRGPQARLEDDASGEAGTAVPPCPQPRAPR